MTAGRVGHNFQRLGLRRQSPELRRLRDLAQIGVDAADPVAFAPYYFRKPLLDENERPAPPRALLSTNWINFRPMPWFSCDGLT